jgi:MoxR-like ATPase
LHGRYFVSTEDIFALAAPVLRHRIVTTFGAQADRITADAVVDRLIRELPKRASAPGLF